MSFYNLYCTGEKFENNEEYFDPVSLTRRTNIYGKPVCTTTPFFDASETKKLQFVQYTDNSKEATYDEVVENFINPPIEISFGDYIETIYGLVTVDQFYQHMNELLENDTPYKTIERLTDCFIFFRAPKMKIPSIELINIYSKICEKYWNIKKVNKDKIEEAITLAMNRVRERNVSFEWMPNTTIKKHLL